MSLTYWGAYGGVTFIALLGLAADVSGQGDRRQQSRQVVQDHLNSLGSVRMGKRLKLEDLQSEDLRKVFDRCDFFLLRYPRYPVEVVPATPLQVNNLFIVCDGHVTRVSDETALRAFFLQRFPVAADDTMMAGGARSWLFLAQELQQDGFLSFGSPSVRTTGSVSEGFVDVTEESGEGRLSVTMEFTGGRLSNVSSGGQALPGARRLK